MKAVHFGAGNIGRGFIGLLLSESGYNVFFVTRNPQKIALLQRHRHYRVTLAKAGATPITVRNVTAASIEDRADVARAVSEADLVTTAVGVVALKSIAGSIARGVRERLRTNPRPLNIIACENAIGASTQLKRRVYAHLPDDLKPLADRYIAFPNTVVDRIVPAQTHDDILAVTVEPFAEWVIDRTAIVGDPPPIRGAQYVESLAPYIERKLYTLNTGHAAAAYHGYLAGVGTIHEVMAHPRLRAKVEAVLEETGALLTARHHFPDAVHRAYVQKTLARFANERLRDRVTRVARNPIRKLSRDDRLVGPALKAQALGIPTPHLIAVIAAALLFDDPDDRDAAELQARIARDGIEAAITEVAGVPPANPLHGQIAGAYRWLKKRRVTRPSPLRAK